VLKSSHIIPNSYFKQMKQGGKLVRFDLQEHTAVTTGQDSWQESLNLPEFEFDSFKTFLLSILWRASVSTHERFSEVMLTSHDREQLRAALLGGSTAALKEWSIEIRKIVDRRGTLELEPLILAPMNRSEPGQLAYRFVFGGYLIDFKFRPKTVGRGMLLDASAFHLQSIAMIDVPEVMHAGVIAIDKGNRGLDRRVKR
jgi:hypothetical protein